MVTTETNRDSQTAAMDDYRNSEYYKNLNIDGLQEQLKGYMADDDAIRQHAETQYKPTYDAELESLRQQLQQQQWKSFDCHP